MEPSLLERVSSSLPSPSRLVNNFKGEDLYRDSRVQLSRPLPFRIKVVPLVVSLLGTLAVFAWSQAVIFTIIAVEGYLKPEYKVQASGIDYRKNLKDRFRRFRFIPSAIPWQQLVFLWAVAGLSTLVYLELTTIESEVSEEYYESKVVAPDNTVFIV